MKDIKQSVYNLLTEIPKGMVVTYGDIAEKLGNKNLCRAVGNALHINSEPVKYPCFKVVNASGGLAENFGGGGKDVQKARLEADGVEVINYTVDLKKYRYKFK